MPGQWWRRRGVEANPPSFVTLLSWFSYSPPKMPVLTEEYFGWRGYWDDWWLRLESSPPSADCRRVYLEVHFT